MLPQMKMTSNSDSYSNDREIQERADIQAGVVSKLTAFAGDVSMAGVR